MMRSFIAALLVSSAAALSTVTTSTQGVFAGLQTTPLVRASDASSTLLTSQWRQNTPFGIADETVVVAFLRHYGW